MAAIDLKPTIFDRLLALGAALLTLAVAAALIRGQAHWSAVPLLIWAHLATVLVALVLTPVMLLRTRGDVLHRRIGGVWCAALFSTALLSLGIRVINPGSLSPIHILSVVTLIGVPRLIVAARQHRIADHRRGVRTIVALALLVAGFFTFPFGRMLGSWLFA